MRRLRALDIAEERALAGQVAGALYLTGAVSVSLLLLLPGIETAHWEVVIAIAAAGAAWGVVCLTLVRWSSAPPIVSLLSSGAGFPITAGVMAATGGAGSPARFYLFFIVFYCSYFYPPRTAVVFLVGCIAVEALPLVYDDGAVEAGYVGEVVLVGAVYLVLGGLILAGKQVLVSLREEAQDLSRHDSLTGVHNRRAFGERMAEHLGGDRTSDRIGLLLVDLDAFKDVNTDHGFPAGDRVLIATAEALQGAIRDVDFVARLGGDEFALIISGAGEERMRMVCDRVLSSIRETGVALELPDFSLHASVGWALYPDDATSAEDLLAVADLALRGAKAGGKDRAATPSDWLPEAPSA
jgi:diguanylate cyclase (GGDEF)-like protein